MIGDTLEECHRQLGKLLGSEAEPIEVLRCAEEHRAYWRPRRVRIILLAESHVYTERSELGRRVSIAERVSKENEAGKGTNADMPEGFVRLVYCLGYGENDLLDRPLPQNTGTPQFWKIFYSCVNQVRSNADFAPVLKGQTALKERTQNKLALLEQLKERGVWLLDASVAALYLPGRPKPAPTVLEACIRTSWDEYVGPVVKAADPSHIVCIGAGVQRALKGRLDELGVPVTIIAQPNARLSAAQHFEGFQRYYSIMPPYIRTVD